MIIARMKFIKGEEVKYISHLDLQRAFQRALRRGQIDIAYSQGFNPHSKISFAMALSVGMTSEGEYVDIELNDLYDADELIIKLNNVLPNGLQIKKCIISDEKHPSLMSTIRMGLYKVKVYTQNTPNKTEIEKRIGEFLQQQEIKIEKTNKRGKLVEKDIRQLIETLIVEKVEKNIIYIELKLATGSQNNVKPELVIEKLVNFGDMLLSYDLLKIHRVDLFAKIEGKYLSPIKLFSQQSGRENM